MGKTKTTSTGRNAGILGGIVNAGAGKHAYKTTGPSGTGHGSTRQKSQDSYNSNASKKKG